MALPAGVGFDFAAAEDGVGEAGLAFPLGLTVCLELDEL
jgi:hypothetical protein